MIEKYSVCLRWVLLFTACLCLSVHLEAQQPEAPSSADIYQRIQKLKVLGSVLYIAAHPDDENTRLLAYLANARGYRTAYLSLTRGDGGQNLIGDEQGIDLGLIRTQELLAARRIDGAEQYFTRAFDFGYSKTPEETFSKWGRENILSDVVLLIRRFRPDVIITRFPTTGEGGHGHHTASAILANEAFAAAADPKRFPAQLNTLQPWQARRILWNTFNFGTANTTREDQLKIDVGAWLPLMGKSIGELAAESRSQHRSQGFGVASSRGEATEYFATTGGAQPKTDLLEDVDARWSRVPGGEGIENAIDSLLRGFRLDAPVASLPGLLGLRRRLGSLRQTQWVEQKRRELDDIIAAAGGLWLEASTARRDAVQGDSLRISFTAIDRSGAGFRLLGVQTAGTDTALGIALPPNRSWQWSRTAAVSKEHPVTQPYWIRDKMQPGYFVVTDTVKIGQADIDTSFLVTFRVAIDGEELRFVRPVRYKYTDPVRGEIYQPLVVKPALSIQTEPSLVLMQKGVAPKVELTLTANRNLPEGNVDMRMASADFGLVRSLPFDSVAAGGSRSYSFDIVPNHPSKPFLRQTLQPHAQLFAGGTWQGAAYITPRTIAYEHIPTQTYFYNDGVTVVPIDLKTAGKRIGYITGAGDKVPQALTAMGYTVLNLDETNLGATNLGTLDAIITGVRAHNTHAWLDAHYDRLMAYVRDGGNLIVQYNTASGIGPLRSRIGPHPFTVSRTRITNEEAAVNFVLPTHRVLNFPNKIAATDFEGWVQERSIYHAAAWDKSFEAPLSMADPGEAADAGALITAKVGKGYFTYTGLALFRQLPAGVPGAYRLLANMIALNAK